MPTLLNSGFLCNFSMIVQLVLGKEESELHSQVMVVCGPRNWNALSHSVLCFIIFLLPLSSSLGGI